MQILSVTSVVHALRAATGRGTTVCAFGLISLLFILMITFSSALAHAQEQHHILILHSYHKGLRWTDTVDTGMMAVISRRGLAFETHTEYLDTKRSSDEDHYLQTRDMFHRKFRTIKFNAILVSDDDAYNFMLRFRDELFPGVPVVFCGVNYFSDFTDDRQRATYTGVVEAFDVAGTLKTALHLHPGTHHVVVINDRSTTGEANKRIIQGIASAFAPKIAFDFFEDFTMEELRMQLRQLKPGSIVLLMTFNRDRAGKVFNYDESIKLIAEAAPVPIYGVWDFYLGSGIVGGMLTSGKDHGRIAAEMALKIIDGTPVQNLPVVRESPNHYMFDFWQLERFRIPLDRLPASAFIMNKPVSFYEEHSEKVWLAGSAFTLLGCLVAALLVNIRMRRKSEESLRISEEKFSKIFRSSPDWIAISRLSDNRYIDVNEAYLKTTGFSRDEVIGKTPFELGIYANEQDRYRLLEILREQGRVLQQEMVFRMKSGELRTVQRSAETIEVGGELLAISIVRDITEEKTAKEALIASEQRHRAIFENASEAIFIIEAEGEEAGKIVAANPAAATMHGYDLDEIVGLSIKEIDAPESAEGVGNRIGRMLQGQWINEEILHRRSDGSIFPVELNAGVFELHGHKYVLGFDRDITARKQTEAALRESERRFRDMLEKMRLIAIIYDRDGKITFCNEYFLSLTGMVRNKVIGADWFDKFIPEADRPERRTAFAGMIAGDAFHPHSEEDLLTNRGETRRIAWNTTLLRDPHGSIIGIATIGEDISERQKLEEQLRQAQKMEAVGQLAGGIAHDFNNILTATIGYCHLLLAKQSADDPSRYYTEQILSSAEKAATLTQGLLAFSRKQMINPKAIDLNATISAMRDLAMRLLSEDIEFVTDLAEGPLAVMADASQIEQVVLNLLTNARDAMPSGGYLSLRTEIAAIDESYFRFHGHGKQGIYALLTVSDTGEGIDESVHSHIFEPFFTTKEIGKGTGLGLSMVYGIVKQHEGYIDFYSSPGEGTTFKIYLPLISVDTTGAPAEALSVPVRGGTETILIIEDNAGVRDILRQVLQEHGYTIIEAVDGEAGIDEYQRRRESIDMVICDVIMPKKSGKEVCDTIRAIDPDIRILFTSGYTADIIGKKGILGMGLQFIRKPLSPAELLHKVREVLDSTDHASCG